MTFSELRTQYPKFIFHGMDVQYNDGALCFSYHFEIPGLYSFQPAWKIRCPEPKNLKEPALQRLLFSLGMAELVSYWKITCSPVVSLPYVLTDGQKQWWKKLYFGGLGEFFYRNQFITDEESFMEMECTDAVLPDTAAQKPLSGKLIPIGGGKDSIVTLNLLKDQSEMIKVLIPLEILIT